MAKVTWESHSPDCTAAYTLFRKVKAQLQKAQDSCPCPTHRKDPHYKVGGSA